MVPVYLQGSWSCSALSRWTCAPRRRCGEVSSGFDSLDLSFRISQQSPCFKATKEDGGEKRLEQLELVCELMAWLRQVLLNLAIAAIAEAILVWISVEQVPFLHRVAPIYLKMVTSFNFCPLTLVSTLQPRSGQLRTQKLKSHLLRTQSLKVLPLKSALGQYIYTCYAFCQGFLPS